MEILLQFLFAEYFFSRALISAKLGCDDIIRQHKAACLRITALLTCKDILWVGTSAGVIATMHLPYLAQHTSKIHPMPTLVGKFGIIIDLGNSIKSYLLIFYFVFSGNPHGHSGHVRFLTCVEMTPEFSRTPFGKNHGRFSARSGKTGQQSNVDGMLGNAAGAGEWSNSALTDRILWSLKNANRRCLWL